MNWDEVAETTAVTSNPAAGTIAVDVKTFTGRGRVTTLYCTCVADANVATRTITAAKVTSAGNFSLAVSATFAAAATGVLVAVRGWTPTPGTNVYASLGQVDFAPGDILRVTVDSGQAGDDLSTIKYSYKEML